MLFREINEIREVTFKGLEDNYFICEIILGSPRTRRINNVRVTQKYGEANAKLKIPENNIELLSKVKAIRKNRKVIIRYRIPKGVSYYARDCLGWELIDILDEIDLLELSNKKTLIPSEIPKRENKVKKKSSKDIIIEERDRRIAELEEQIQMLQEKLQNIK